MISYYRSNCLFPWITFYIALFQSRLLDSLKKLVFFIVIVKYIFLSSEVYQKIARSKLNKNMVNERYEPKWRGVYFAQINTLLCDVRAEALEHSIVFCCAKNGLLFGVHLQARASLFTMHRMVIVAGIDQEQTRLSDVGREPVPGCADSTQGVAIRPGWLFRPRGMEWDDLRAPLNPPYDSAVTVQKLSVRLDWAAMTRQPLGWERLPQSALLLFEDLSRLSLGVN